MVGEEYSEESIGEKRRDGWMWMNEGTTKVDQDTKIYGGHTTTQSIKIEVWGLESILEVWVYNPQSDRKDFTWEL